MPIGTRTASQRQDRSLSEHPAAYFGCRLRLPWQRVLYLLCLFTIRNPLPPTSKAPVPYLVNNLREDLLATNGQPDHPARRGQQFI